MNLLNFIFLTLFISIVKASDSDSTTASSPSKTQTDADHDQEPKYTIETGLVTVARERYGKGATLQTNLFWKKFTPNIKSEKPMVLIIPGGPNASHQYLIPVAEMIAKLEYPVLIFDPRGCGESDIATYNFGSLDMEYDLDDIVKELLPDHNFVLLGHSSGGLLGALYTYNSLQYPDLYSNKRQLGTILMNSAPLFIQEQSETAKFVSSIPWQRKDPWLAIAGFLAQKNLFFRSEWFMNKVLDKTDEIFVADPAAASVSVMGGGSENINREKYLAFAKHFDGGTPVLDYSKKKVDIHNLYCIGSDKDIIPVATFESNAQKIREKILQNPDEIHTQIIPDADHSPWISAPDKLREVLARILLEICNICGAS